MSGEREELIRQRAYALWEKDGGAHGRHDDHWAQATREVDVEEATPPKPLTRAGTPKPVGKGPVAARKAMPKSAAPAPAPVPPPPSKTPVSPAAKGKAAKPVPKAAKPSSRGTGKDR